jgi:hypothetical protein
VTCEAGTDRSRKSNSSSLTNKEEATVAMGGIVVGFTMFGMLALVIASVYTDDGDETAEVNTQTTDSSDAESYKKAA